MVLVDPGWCVWCNKAVIHPVPLPCGHQVCGSLAIRKCELLMREYGKCKSQICVGRSTILSRHNNTTRPNKEEVLTPQKPASNTDELWVGPKGCLRKEIIISNGLKKLLVLGKTGTGKSSLCNVLAGLEPTSTFFPTSPDPESCTHDTKFADVQFNNDIEKMVSIIDTVGFHDPKIDEDAIIISDLVSKLRSCCDFLNLIAIAVNAHEPRLDNALVGMIGIFQELFGERFWTQTVIIFTRLPMDRKSVERRKQNQTTDDAIATKYLHSLEGKFSSGKGLKYLFVDAFYDPNDFEEKAAFEDSLNQLWNWIEDSSRLHTLQINPRAIEARSVQVKHLIEEYEKELTVIKKLKDFFAKSGEGLTDALQNFDKKMKEYTDRYYAHDKAIREEYEKKMQQKQLEQDALKMKYEKQIEENRKFFEKKLNSLQSRINFLEGQLETQNAGQNPPQPKQIQALIKQRQMMKEQQEKDSTNLENEYSTLLKKMEQEKDIVFSEFLKMLEGNQSESKIDSKSGLAEKNQPQLSLRTRDSSSKQPEGNSKSKSSSNIKISVPAAKEKGQNQQTWRGVAYETFLAKKGSHLERLEAVKKALETQNSTCYWGVFICDQKGSWVVASRGKGSSAVSIGEEEAFWNDIQIEVFGSKTICTLYAWKAPRSTSNKHRTATANEEEKLIEIKLRIQKRKADKAPEEQWDIQRWSDELVTELNAESIQWKHLVMANHLHFRAQHHSLFYWRSLELGICFGS